MRRALRVALVFVGAAALTVGARLAIDAHRRARAERIAQVLVAASGPLMTECRWERPVVGGEPRDCNTIEAVDAAVNALFADAPEGAMASTNMLDALATKWDAPPAVAPFVESHAAGLRAVRDAARCAWACERGTTRVSYRRGSRHDALELLLFQARVAPPDECRAIALDVLGLLEDERTGFVAAFAGNATGTALVVEARRTLVACGPGGALDATARDATALAARVPPIGDALALRSLMTGTSLVEEATHPDAPGAENILWVQRGLLLDVADAEAARLPTLRAYRDDDERALLARLDADTPKTPWIPFAAHAPTSWAASAGDLVGGAPAALRAVVEARALFDRELRLLAVAMGALRDRTARAAWPEVGPAELAAPALRDPLTGAPFGWSVHGRRAELRADGVTSPSAAPPETVMLTVDAEN
jgi:hypothetical protein